MSKFIFHVCFWQWIVCTNVKFHSFTRPILSKSSFIVATKWSIVALSLWLQSIEIRINFLSFLSILFYRINNYNCTFYFISLFFILQPCVQMLKYLVFVVEVHGADDSNFNHQQENKERGDFSKEKSEMSFLFVIWGGVESIYSSQG